MSNKPGITDAGIELVPDFVSLVLRLAGNSIDEVVVSHIVLHEGRSASRTAVAGVVL